jgi:hypothetical protein
MRWNRFTVQPFLTVRVHVLNSTPKEAFRAIHRSLKSAETPAGPRLSVPQPLDTPRRHPIEVRIASLYRLIPKLEEAPTGEPVHQMNGIMRQRTLRA